MQNLDIISVNLWQILSSLANLALLFLILKKFLYAPLKKTLASRQEEIDSTYGRAEEAENQALEDKNAWSEKLKNASDEASAIIRNATVRAENKSDKIVSRAKEEADRIVRDAKAEAELDRKKAEASMKREIVSVATALAEKMLEREIDPEDHRDIISSCIDTVGGADE